MIKLENFRFFVLGLMPAQNSNGVYGFAKTLLLLITYFLNAIICIAYKIVNSIYFCCNSSKVSRTVFKKWFDGEICIRYDCLLIYALFQTLVISIYPRTTRKWLNSIRFFLRV